MSQPEKDRVTTSSNIPSNSVNDAIADPPRTLFGILRRLGPGLIVAGSIVGSGELILTTKTGAQGGIALLWLILVGCVIKVFVQIELGRYTLSAGETTLAAFNRLPGPRLRGNWVLWFWLITMVAVMAQQGGIVGGVGQALALTWPITGDYVDAIQVPSDAQFNRYLDWEQDAATGGKKLRQLSGKERARIKRGLADLKRRIDRLGPRGQRILGELRHGRQATERFAESTASLKETTAGDAKVRLEDPWTLDDKLWATIVAIVTAGMLYRGRYRFIQNFSMFLVVTFTCITIGNVVALQTTDTFRISVSDFVRGLSFGAPAPLGHENPWLTALATFGIIGVGAMELIVYPYWCLEKGYARFTGQRSNDPAWVDRAKGWLKVMHYDAFISMVVYTVATVAFFLMGVAVLHREGLDPDGMRMVSTLAEAYVPVFGSIAKWLFLVGAIAVLYSTFLVAAAGHARMIVDALGVVRLLDRDNATACERSVVGWSVFLPLLALAAFLTGVNPVELVMISGTMQAALLPIVGMAALVFRYKWTTSELRPHWAWDVCLIISCIGVLIAGVWGIYHRFV